MAYTRTETVNGKAPDASGDITLAVADVPGAVSSAQAAAFALKSWFNVRSYGATGDGTTDDHVAVQAALSAANAASPGACLYFPAGSYKGLTRLLPGVGVSIVGDGAAASVLSFPANNDAAILGAGNNVGAVFRDFTLNLINSSSAPAAPLTPAGYCSPSNFGGGAVTTVIGLCPGPYAEFCSVERVFITGGSIGLVLAVDKGTTVRAGKVNFTRGPNMVIDGGFGGAGSSTVGINHINVEDMLFSQANASGNATDAEVVANVKVVTNNGYPPRRVTFAGNHFDEPNVTATVQGHNIYLAAGEDITIRDSTVNVPVGPVGSTRYGVYVGATCVRTKLSNVRVCPYVDNDATRVATSTILVAPGAADTLLEDVTTSTSGGGGDIADAGTRTLYRNVNRRGSVGAQYKAGLYYTAPVSNNPVSRPNGYMTTHPFKVENQHTFTGIAAEVMTAGQAGALLRLGVYASDAFGVPGALVLDAGTVAGDSTGVKSLTGLVIALSPGIYHLAACVQAAGTTQPQVRGSGAGSMIPYSPVATAAGLGTANGFANGGAGQGALPNPAAVGASPADTAITVALIG